MMRISPPYLSDIEKGYRAAPLKVINGKDRMADFIKLLSITNDELPKFYEQDMERIKIYTYES